MKTKVLFVLFSLLFFVSCPETTTTLSKIDLNTGCFGNYPHNYQQMVIDQFSTILYDPPSAQYYFVDPIKVKDGKRYGYLIQVEVDARNRTGEYSDRYIYHFMIQDSDIWETNIFYNSIRNYGNEKISR